MRVPCTEQPQPRRPRRSLGALLTLLAGALLGGAVAWALLDGRAAFSGWLNEAGHHRMEHRQGVVSALLAAPARLLRELPAPHLELEIGFRGIQSLREQQRAAVQLGRIDTAAKQEVSAQVNVAGKRRAAKVRLKGDNLDHVLGPKVSMRIAVDADERPVLGLREFSLQAPPTKGFHLEALFHATVRHAGVLSPRYEFVRAGCNGEHVGVMALEEHCGKELLERLGRREGVVVRFEEDALFAEQARLNSIDPQAVAYDDYRTAPVRAFAEADIVANPLLKPQRDLAVALLRSFVEGRLAASEAFDVDELARYLAACELWGSWHALRWHNLRFYYDSVRARLVPIGFDGNLHMRRRFCEVVTPREPFVRRLLDCAPVYAAFRAHLRGLAQSALDGPLLRELRELEARALPLLQTDYPLLEGFPFEELRTRARYCLELSDSTLQTPPTDAALVPILAVRDGPNGFAVWSASAEPALVQGLRWRWPDGRTQAANATLPLPLALPGKPATGPVPSVRLAVDAPPSEDVELEVEARLQSVGERHWVLARRQSATRARPILPEPTVADALAKHRFLVRDDDGVSLRVQPGRHEVQGDLIVPPGSRLLGGAGTQLLFAAHAMLLAHGPVQLEGRADAPFELLPLDATWRGVAVLAPDAGAQSNWRHVRVGRTTGVERSDYQLTGGVSFHRGRVLLEHVEFAGTSAEDALNVIRAELVLRHARFAQTVSDAFDGDFVRGEVANCEFHDIQGDAVDVSGASVTVRACRMLDVRDKALSVGEGSAVEAFDLHAERVGVGAACKDASTLRLQGAQIVDARFAGLMAYEKKPEFGPSAVQASEVQCRGAAPVARVQRGSTLSIDGQPVADEPIDIGVLYETVMRKR